MGRLLLIIALMVLPGLQLFAQQHECKELPMSWNSEKEAITKIENTLFSIQEDVSPKGNSWMSAAHFYACEDHGGYLIVKGALKGKKEKSYVHQNVPVEIWNSFKKANSMGGFYHIYIKNYYKLTRGNSKSS